MLNLIGEYECRLDGKSRISMPSGLLRQLPTEVDIRFVINRGFEAHLVLYPATVWTEIAEKVNSLNTYVIKNRQFQRYFFRGATEIKLDNNKRLLLPKQLLEYAGIATDITLFAYSDRIEVWSTQRYRDSLDEEPEDFAELAQEVMGGKVGDGGTDE